MSRLQPEVRALVARLREARLARGVEQLEIAALHGVSHGTKDGGLS